MLLHYRTMCVVIMALLSLSPGCSTSPASHSATTVAATRADVPTDAVEPFITLDSPLGERMLRESEGFSQYVRLSMNFATQQNLAYCGVATGSVVLNAMGGARPSAAALGKYRLFIQDNFFTPEVEQTLHANDVQRNGMTLSQFADAMRAHGCAADVAFADATSVENFRQRATEALRTNSSFVVVNFHRPSVGQEGPGHLSPLGAYHAASDRFLLMDVATYKYPFEWIAADRLFRGMATVDSDSGKSRGFAIVSGPGDVSAPK